MNYDLIARFLLRLIALALVTWGNVSEDAASILYLDPDFVAMGTLMVSEGFFIVSKWRNKRAET